jgi:amino acid transporter
MGLWSSVGVLIGITIGSGIFRTPAQVASNVPNPRWMLAVWILGGLISLCGALSLAELAAALPRTGGLYVYLREGWGRLASFLFGWSQLVLIRASAVGAIATVFGEYFLRSFGLTDLGPVAADLVAVAAIVVAATTNVLGAQWGAAIAGLSTLAKTGALLLIAGAVWMTGSAHGAQIAHFATAAGPVEPGLFGLALVSVLWAYDGFADLSFVGGEIRDPQRTLPRALLLGTSAIVVLYLMTNVAYLYVNPVDPAAAPPTRARAPVSRARLPCGSRRVHSCRRLSRRQRAPEQSGDDDGSARCDLGGCAGVLALPDRAWGVAAAVIQLAGR